MTAGRSRAVFASFSCGTRLSPSLSLFAREPAEFEERRVEVEQFRRPRRTSPRPRCPGPAKMSGTRVERSQSVFLPVMPFSPRCQPWSLQSTTIVFFSSPLSCERVEHAADLASTKLTLARYARTSGFHWLFSSSHFSRGSGSFQCRYDANRGRSSRSSAFTGGMASLSSG